jgi:hypothetical protein
MGASDPVSSALASAHKALDNANKFTHSVTGGKPNAFAGKPQPSYTQAHSERKAAASSGSGSSFLGQGDNSAEINSREEMNDAAKKALAQP